jgi:hypothetical protein
VSASQIHHDIAASVAGLVEGASRDEAPRLTGFGLMASTEFEDGGGDGAQGAGR